ncbi:MAG: UDP-4-amino-4,6-dideoxy-N-acetyl-beta-L-altrosamine transaminase [candidate division Zixibacteria bacterium]|nr:UDP-4-amino-4,6-dideoxy-N-acetyl-beta-L-altrosamine transaminase [candidate division Zixibacteria bacterium]
MKTKSETTIAPVQKNKAAVRFTESSGKKFLPYGRQHISEKDIQAVVDVLRSDWLTQGPAIESFEQSLAAYLKSPNVIACSNGTAALHLAMLALNIGPGDVVVTTPNTFVADANCARYVGADVCLVDIEPSTGNIDINALESVLKHDNDRSIKAIVPVHFAGQPVDIVRIHQLAKAHEAWIVDDACHALGAEYSYQGKSLKIGSGKYSDITVFSFHPVKHVATGEGGALSTASDKIAAKLRALRTHGIQRESFEQQEMAINADGLTNPWYYEMLDLGFNYRLTDIQATLGQSQLERIQWSVTRRNEIAELYRDLIAKTFSQENVWSLKVKPGLRHAYHLFVVQIDFEKFGVSRAKVMNALHESGIGTQVHYIPIHLQSYYRKFFPKPFSLPYAEAYYSRALSLPMYPDLTDEDCQRVVIELYQALMTR